MTPSPKMSLFTRTFAYDGLTYVTLTCTLTLAGILKSRVNFKSSFVILQYKHSRLRKLEFIIDASNSVRKQIQYTLDFRVFYLQFFYTFDSFTLCHSILLPDIQPHLSPPPFCITNNSAGYNAVNLNVE